MMTVRRKYLIRINVIAVRAALYLVSISIAALTSSLGTVFAAPTSDNEFASASLKSNQKLIEAGRRAVASSDWQIGITLLTQALRRDPGCEDCLYWRAVAAVNSGKGSAALADIALLEKLKTRAYMQFLLPLKVGALHADGKFEAANRLADRLITQGDQNAFLYYMKANLLKEQGQFEQALKFHEGASDRRTPSWRTAHAQLLLSCALDTRCSLRPAKEYLKQAESLHPAEDYWIKFAGVLAKRAHLKEAVQAVRESDRLERRLKMTPDRAQEKARVLKDVGLHKEAVALIDRYRRRLPNNSSILMTEVEILNAAGLHEALVPLARQLLKSGQCKPAPVRMFLCQALTHLNRTDEALAEAQKEVEARPANSASYLMRANVLIARKEPDLALIDLNKALALDPNLYAVRCARASLFMNLMQGEKAISDLDYAIRLEPNRGYAYSLRATCYRDYLLDLDKAKADLSKSRRLSP